VVKIVGIPCVVVGHEQKKEAISPPFVLRQGKVDINEHSHT